MDRAMCMLAGAGIGAGLMYLFDPQMGRRRRAIARDKAVRLTHEAQDAARVVGKDMKNRAQGLASGDLSVLAGGKRALHNPLRGGWSPSARGLMALAGGGLFLFGLTQEAPTACFLGTAGLALTAEALTNAGIDDITHVPQNLASKATDVADGIAEGLGLREQSSHAQRQPAAQPAGAGA